MGTDFRRQNLTSKDGPYAERVNWDMCLCVAVRRSVRSSNALPAFYVEADFKCCNSFVSLAYIYLFTNVFKTSPSLQNSLSDILFCCRSRMLVMLIILSLEF